MRHIFKPNEAACFKRWNRRGYSVFASLHRHVTIGVLSVAMSLVTLASNEAYAAEVDTLSVSKVVEIEDVEILLEKQSPTRSAMSQTPIFNRTTELAAPIQTLESALRLSASVDVRERGGKGVQADFSIRGGSFDQTMMMLNGINFTDARTGHQTHALPIDIESIAGIDIIDGIAGVGAYAGAINIRTAPLSENYARVEASGGAYGYGYGNISGAYTVGDLSIYAVGSYRRSDGYISNTDFANYNGYVRLNYDSEKLGFFDAQAGFQDREFGANGFYSLKYLEQYEATQTWLSSLRWFKSFGALRLNASASYRKNFDRFELIKGDQSLVPFNYHMTDNAGAELWGDYKTTLGTTSLGVDYTYNHIWSTVLGELQDEANGRYTKAKDRSVANYWLRHVYSHENYTLSGSYGFSTSPYGSNSLWSVSAAYRPAEGLSIGLGATQSMRLPTFTDLYYTATGYVSNPDLEPEEAITYRLSADYSISDWSFGAVAYVREGSNTIDWVRATADDDWQSIQITDLTTFGSELMVNYRPEDFLTRVSASLGYITMDKDSGEMISKYATDYMQHKGALSLEFSFLRNCSLVLTASAFDRKGNYTDVAGETVAYEPYVLLDSRLSWQKGKYKVYIDATNITSTDYFDYGGLEMPGLWAVAGVAITL